jgi:hypothetical protein
MFGCGSIIGGRVIRIREWEGRRRGRGVMVLRVGMRGRDGDDRYDTVGVLMEGRHSAFE